MQRVYYFLQIPQRSCVCELRKPETYKTCSLAAATAAGDALSVVGVGGIAADGVFPGSTYLPEGDKELLAVQVAARFAVTIQLCLHQIGSSGLDVCLLWPAAIAEGKKTATTGRSERM